MYQSGRSDGSRVQKWLSLFWATVSTWQTVGMTLVLSYNSRKTSSTAPHDVTIPYSLYRYMDYWSNNVLIFYLWAVLFNLKQDAWICLYIWFRPQLEHNLNIKLFFMQVHTINQIRLNRFYLSRSHLQNQWHLANKQHYCHFRYFVFRHQRSEKKYANDNSFIWNSVVIFENRGKRNANRWSLLTLVDCK